jgi:hypothetical protein
MKEIIFCLKLFIFLLFIPWLLIGCIGIGRSLIIEEPFNTLPFDRAWEIALLSAQQMCEEARKVNPYNFPVIFSSSKTDNIITLMYEYKPPAGSIGKPPDVEKVFWSRDIPFFAARFSVKINLIKQGDQATGVKIEVKQITGVKKEEFDREAENLKNYYFSFLRKNWKP